MQIAKPYRYLIAFVAVMLTANVIWKLSVNADAHTVRWWGWDITCLFDACAKQTAASAYYVAHFFKPTLLLSDDIILYYPNGHSTTIAWSCTPIKQLFIFLCIMLATPPFTHRIAWHKLWYIPLSMTLLYVANILRIALIACVIDTHPEYFTLLHTYILKYLFYGIVFLLWGAWVYSQPSNTSAP